jgi:hypothetical protein
VVGSAARQQDARGHLNREILLGSVANSIHAKADVGQLDNTVGAKHRCYQRTNLCRIDREDARFSHLAKPVGIVVVHKSPQRAKSDVVVALEVAVRSEWVILVLGDNSEVCNRVGLLRKVAVEWVSGCMEMVSKGNGEARCGTSSRIGTECTERWCW